MEMIKKSIVKVGIDLLRWSARAFYLITAIFIAFFVCWFVFQFLGHLMDWCENTIFSGPWR
jgi:uncharacterized membrane protein